MRAIKKIIIFNLFSFLMLTIVSAQKKINYTAIMRSNVGVDTMWDGTYFRIYGITDKLSAQPEIPAKILYANEGDTVVLNVLNISQNSHHTIHLHGLDVDTRNDGDPATSFALVHMQDTTYTFIAKHAGTYIYHCHAADVVHVQLGMYGLIVVKAKNGANTTQSSGGEIFHKSYNWLLSEIDKSWHINIPEHDINSDTLSIPLYKPQYFLINGKSETELLKDSTLQITGRRFEKIYLRMGAIGFFTNQIIFPKELTARILDSDGRPLPNAVVADTLCVAPGERYGVMLQSEVEIKDAIKINFINMNTDSIWSTQKMPVNISGTLGSEKMLIKKLPFKIYPNPSSGLINIKLESNQLQNYKAQIMDYNGKVILNKDFDSEILIINQKLANGLYVIRVFTETENYYTKMNVQN